MCLTDNMIVTTAPWPGVCPDDGQTEAYLKNMGKAGLASAWAMARRRPKEYRRKVEAATRCSGVCPHT